MIFRHFSEEISYGEFGDMYECRNKSYDVTWSLKLHFLEQILIMPSLGMDGIERSVA